MTNRRRYAHDKHYKITITLTFSRTKDNIRIPWVSGDADGILPNLRRSITVTGQRPFQYESRTVTDSQGLGLRIYYKTRIPLYIMHITYSCIREKKELKR